MSEMAEAYLEGCDKAGRPQIRRNIRACRFIYVSDTQKKAREELRPTITPSIERHKRGFPHHFAHCLPPSGDVMDITWDYLVDGGHWFVGGPDEVYDLCKHHYDESGGFGTLCLVVGKDWGTRQQRARSMKLFMEKVALASASWIPTARASSKQCTKAASLRARRVARAHPSRGEAGELCRGRNGAHECSHWSLARQFAWHRPLPPHHPGGLPAGRATGRRPLLRTQPRPQRRLRCHCRRRPW